MNERLTVPEAARVLGISEGAVRQRLQRGSLPHEKDEDGRVYVVLSRDNDEQTYGHTPQDDRIVEILESQNAFLRQQLEQEREANRENRRLLAAALERIPELEAPSAARESPETPAEEPYSTHAPPEGYGTSPQEAEESLHQRSWWRRFFGLE